MIKCKYKNDDCCELVSQYGNISLEDAKITHENACIECLKTETPNNGECNSVVASLVMFNVKRVDPERNSETRQKFLPYCRQQPPGPGTELKKIFDKMLIHEVGGCKCAPHATTMNRWGPDKCLQKIDTIVGWLQEEAKKRGLPFSKIVAKAIIRLAIRRSRKILK